MRVLVSAPILLYFFFYPVLAQAEKIRGRFNRLPLMREIASQDRNRRAVKNIVYIYETPDGEYFEVDNNNPPIESLIFKTDKTKQRKPLDEVKDENFIIYYYHRVDSFAEQYYGVVDPMIQGLAPPPEAMPNLIKLKAEYRDFGATYRALGATALASGNVREGVWWTQKAFSVNEKDPKALLLLSIGQYALGYTDASSKYLQSATYIEPEVTHKSWEIQYIEENNPAVFNGWLKDIGKSEWK